MSLIPGFAFIRSVEGYSCFLSRKSLYVAGRDPSMCQVAGSESILQLDQGLYRDTGSIGPGVCSGAYRPWDS